MERLDRKTLPTITLPQGKTLLLEGSSSVRLEDGDGSILGAPLSGNRLTVREARQVPVETGRGARLDVRIEHGGGYKLVDGSTIPMSWKEASQVLRQSPGTVAIVGDVDSGKSTLCTFLANECINHGLTVSVVDGDIGQADIGPPTTVSAATLRAHTFSLHDLAPDISYFIGETSPSLISGKLLQNLVRLRDETVETAEVLLVNTDGWVRGEEALRYKNSLLTLLHPDFVFGIDTDGDLDPLLDLQSVTTLRLNRSSYARTRSKEERKKAREFGYKRFLERSRRMELSLKRVKLRRFDSHYQLRLDDRRELRGVVAGLLNDGEKLLAIGRIEEISNGMVRIRTVLEETPRILEIGAVVLSSSYEEVGYESYMA